MLTGQTDNVEGIGKRGEVVSIGLLGAYGGGGCAGSVVRRFP